MWNSLKQFLAFFGISCESKVDPLDRTVQRVLAGCSLEELESTPCPFCGAPLTVAFEDDGAYFRVFCKNNQHRTPRTEIRKPPQWWTSRVEKRLAEGEERNYYRPKWSFVAEDGTIHVRFSSWTSECHSCGYAEIPGDSDRAGFWKWILSQPKRFPDLISDEQLSQMTIDYQKERLGS